MKLKFNLQDPALIGLAKHAVANLSSHRAAWSPKPIRLTVPSLLLVKDSGAYLVSPFAVKGAPAQARLCDETGALVAVYAEGCGATDPWIPGDDFAETLPIAELVVKAAADGNRFLVVTVTAKAITTRIE